VEAPPPPEGEGWASGQATYASKSSMLIMDGKPKPCRLYMMMYCPLWMLWCMECRICGVNIKSEGPAYKGARRTDVDTNGVDGIGPGAEEGEQAGASSAAEVVGTSDLVPLAFRGPLNVTVGSSRFQQFFLIYATLMVGLKFSRDIESD